MKRTYLLFIVACAFQGSPAPDGCDGWPGTGLVTYLLIDADAVVRREGDYLLISTALRDGNACRQNLGLPSTFQRLSVPE